MRPAPGASNPPQAGRLVLASGSPRRQQLLALGGWEFQVIAADIDESAWPGEAPAAYALRVAEAKARAVARLAAGETVVVAADTIVVDGPDVLGKPRHAAEAIETLQRLRGRQHLVYTALAVLAAGSGRLLTDLCSTAVPMRSYSEQELLDYVASGDPLDKAGSYAIQHPEFRPVESLQGCYANVVGLPLCHLARLLSRLGVSRREGLPQACQAALGYDCPVYDRILQGTL
jgi:MAF protein